MPIIEKAEQNNVNVHVKCLCTYFQEINVHVLMDCPCLEREMA